MMSQPFSITQVKIETANFECKQPSFLTSHDDIKLAYYAFVPENTKAAVIFYHGGGAWSMPMYQLMAREASERYAIAVYLFDIRGHGHSQGSRGDAPSPQHLWRDIDVAFDMVTKENSEMPIMLAGHSSGA